MQRLTQSPTDPDFVQNPYPFFDRARAGGDLFFWEDYGVPCAVSHRAVSALLKDRRLGREIPVDFREPIPDHLTPFYDVEAHSMLELEPPVHTRLRSQVLRAFTSRRIAGFGPEIAELADSLIDRFPSEPFDLLTQFAQPIPVIIICRLLGVPEDRADDLLRWSNAMVAMYQARRTREIEDAAVAATLEFKAFLTGYIDEKRQRPADDLISELIKAEESGEKLSTDELITTCILLLNAGHEATVHTLGNGVKALIENGITDIDAKTVEEIMRFDPPLHAFSRWAKEDFEAFGHHFKRGDQINCLLGAANRDPEVYENPHKFNALRSGPQHTAFGGGIHFCVGAPLARLELTVALDRLFTRLPQLSLVGTPQYADVYHFHGLERLMVTTAGPAST